MRGQRMLGSRSHSSLQRLSMRLFAALTYTPTHIHKHWHAQSAVTSALKIVDAHANKCKQLKPVKDSHQNRLNYLLLKIIDIHHTYVYL